MNIFILDKNPEKSAKMLCDKHVCKMTLESAQLLCSVFYTNSNVIPPYRLTHKNHPCSRWVRYSKDNFEWLLKHFHSLLQEYTLRYSKIHKCQQIFDWIIDNRQYLSFDNVGLSKFVLAMPNQFKIKNDVVGSYQNYYLKNKMRFAKWKLGNVPDFIKENKLC